MGFAGLMRLEAEAKNSSEKERMREVKGAEIRSRVVSNVYRQLVCRGLSTRELLKGGALAMEEGVLPMHVVPKALFIWSGGM